MHSRKHYYFQILHRPTTDHQLPVDLRGPLITLTGDIVTPPILLLLQIGISPLHYTHCCGGHR